MSFVDAVLSWFRPVRSDFDWKVIVILCALILPAIAIAAHAPRAFPGPLTADERRPRSRWQRRFGFILVPLLATVATISALCAIAPPRRPVTLLLWSRESHLSERPKPYQGPAKSEPCDLGPVVDESLGLLGEHPDAASWTTAPLSPAAHELVRLAELHPRDAHATPTRQPRNAHATPMRQRHAPAQATLRCRRACPPFGTTP